MEMNVLKSGWCKHWWRECGSAAAGDGGTQRQMCSDNIGGGIGEGSWRGIFERAPGKLSPGRKRAKKGAQLEWQGKRAQKCQKCNLKGNLSAVLKNDRISWLSS